MITKVVSPHSTTAHNMNLSADGRWLSCPPMAKCMAIADTTTNQLIETMSFPTISAYSCSTTIPR